MAKFKYKLESLLKIREFKEEMAKNELGHINKEIDRVKREIQSHDQDISTSFTSHNKLIEGEIEGRMIQFYPYYNEGKRAHIRLLKLELADWEQKHIEKLTELNNLRADVKVIQKLKDKDFEIWKKEQRKKEDLEVADFVQMKVTYAKKYNKEIS